MRILLTIFILAGVLFGCGGGGGGGSTDQADVVIGDVTVEITGRAANGSAYPITSGSAIYKLRSAGSWSNPSGAFTIDNTGSFSFDATEDYLNPNGVNLFDVCISNANSTEVYCGMVPVVGTNGVYSSPNTYLNPVTDHAYRIMTKNAGFDEVAYENVITGIADDNNMLAENLTVYSDGENSIETLRANLGVPVVFEHVYTFLQSQLARKYNPSVAYINAHAVMVSVLDSGVNALNHPNITLSQASGDWYIDSLSGGEFAAKFNLITKQDTNGSYDSYLGTDISADNLMATFLTSYSELNANYFCRKDIDSKAIQFQFDEGTDFEGAMWGDTFVVGMVTATAAEYDVNTEGITAEQLSAMPECNESFTNGEQRTVLKQVFFRAVY